MISHSQSQSHERLARCRFAFLLTLCFFFSFFIVTLSMSLHPRNCVCLLIVTIHGQCSSNALCLWPPFCMTNSLQFPCVRCILAYICMDIVCICKISRVVLECCHFEWKHRRNQSRRIHLFVVCTEWKVSNMFCVRCSYTLWTVTVSYDLSYYRKLFIRDIFHSLSTRFGWIFVNVCLFDVRDELRRDPMHRFARFQMLSAVCTWTGERICRANIIWEGFKSSFSKNWPASKFTDQQLYSFIWLKLMIWCDHNR